MFLNVLNQQRWLCGN